MNITTEQRRLLTLCAIRRQTTDDKSIGLDWSLIAREASTPGGLDALYAGQTSEQSKAAAEARDLLRRTLDDFAEAAGRVDAELASVDDLEDCTLRTVLDDDYPATLRVIWNLPPFLFVRGRLQPEDLKAVAVVGTRNATDSGLAKARQVTRSLVDNGVTIVSGLAAGIDTAAHTTTLERDGRTLAVVGTGITRTYPSQNRELAERIIDSGGGIVSQFWPTTNPARWTFPRRNVVTSGISQGTVVVEASKTSGAKMQARLALEHGKRVFLLKSLVTLQPWAHDYVAKRGAVEVEGIDDILRHLAEPDRISSRAESRQMTLDIASA